MDENVYIAELLDCYRALLTDKQADIMNLYYEEDLSLSEITGHYNVTRQAVLDIIKRSVRQLENYECKLGLVKKSRDRSVIVEAIENLCMNLSDKDVSNQIIAAIHKLEV